MHNIHGKPVDLSLSLILCTTCILDGNWNLLKWCWWPLFSMVFCVPSSHKYLCFCATYICLPMGNEISLWKRGSSFSVISSSISQPTAKTILQHAPPVYIDQRETVVVPCWVSQNIKTDLSQVVHPKNHHDVCRLKRSMSVLCSWSINGT